MTRKVSLLFGVHAHQPAGNFPEVIDDAHRRCYQPFIETLYRYPDFRFAMHFSGWLLDYLLRKFPDSMQKLQEMVGRGQVEMFGGGDTEPCELTGPRLVPIAECAGSVTLSGATYGCSSSVGIDLYDSDLDGAGSAVVAAGSVIIGGFSTEVDELS